MGCRFKDETTALSTNGVRVNRAPRASYAAWYFLRNSNSAVMSASSNCVTRGTEFQLSLIRWLMTLRSCAIGFFEIAPQRAKSIASAGRLGAAPGGVGVVRDCDPGFCNR